MQSAEKILKKFAVQWRCSILFDDLALKWRSFFLSSTTVKIIFDSNKKNHVINYKIAFSSAKFFSLPFQVKTKKRSSLLIFCAQKNIATSEVPAYKVYEIL